MRRGHAQHGVVGSTDGTVVQLPPAMGAGGIIGRKGANIKMLQQRSGARITVHAAGDAVIVSGHAQAVAEAVRLIRLQINSFMATGGSYPHPLDVLYLTGTAFGNDDDSQLSFKPRRGANVHIRADEISRATERDEEMYELEPCGGGSSGRAAGRGSCHEAAGLDALLAGMTLGGGQGGSRGGGIALYVHAQRAAAVARVVAAATTGIAHTPGFDEVKLRFNLGKQFFYNGPRDGMRWSVAAMRAKSINRELKSVYCNVIGQQHDERLRAWLLGRGFKHVENKASATLHVVHVESASSYCFSFIRHSDGRVSLRKVKSGNNKLCFLALQCRPGAPDWRAKLLAQYHFKDSEMLATLQDVADSARLVRGRVTVDLDGRDMLMDKERVKDKKVYAGCFASGAAAATDVKITIFKVSSRDRSAGWIEVAAASPQVQELLERCLAAGRVMPTQQAELKVHLTNLLAFGDAASDAMAGTVGALTRLVA